MPRYNKVDVSEQQLEDLVRRYPEYIESGLQFVDHQLMTGSGRLDVLLADSARAIVVSELKVIEDDNMLLQALDYYDYVCSHKKAYARLYKTHELDPTKGARLLLIAPSFSVAMINRCKWITAPISLFTYSCLQVEGAADLTPVFSEQNLQAQPETTVHTHSLQDWIEWITDDMARARARDFVEKARAWAAGVTVDSVQGALSLKISGKVFAYLWPQRKYFSLGTYNLENVWTRFTVKTDEDFARALVAIEDCFRRKRLDVGAA